MNILILSCGTRNKIVQYFKKSLNGIGTIVCADMSKTAPALYEGDKYYIVPCITEIGYMDVIFNICKQEKITAVLSLIDPELSLLAAHREHFKKIGVTIIGSSYELCKMSLNKMDMYNWLISHGYRTARSYINKNDFYKDIDTGCIKYPVFVKPVNGSASLHISKVEDKETIEILFAHHNELMIQEFLEGQEIGADVYIDMITGNVVSIFTKKKLVMRAGETDKSVSFKNEKLFSLIEVFVKDAGYMGEIDIDIFEIDGKYYISEVNPRFGGGYPHAHECGCDHVNLIINNIKGIANNPNIGQYQENQYMMKYNEIKVLAL